jgi:hypothetical protein
MKKLITKKEIEEIVKNSLEIALKEFQVVNKGYFYEETLRYIVVNQINKVLTERQNFVSFPNKKENKYKLVFQFPYTVKKNSVNPKIKGSTFKADLAIIRGSASKFNNPKGAKFYKKIYLPAIKENIGFHLNLTPNNTKLLYFDKIENSFMISLKFDSKSKSFANVKAISDETAFKEYTNYMEKKGINPPSVKITSENQYNGNLMIIELKKLEDFNKIEKDIIRLKGMLHPEKGMEFFDWGVMINFGFKNDRSKAELNNLLKVETPVKRNLLLAHLDPNDNNGVQMKWIN